MAKPQALPRCTSRALPRTLEVKTKTELLPSHYSMKLSDRTDGTGTLHCIRSQSRCPNRATRIPSFPENFHDNQGVRERGSAPPVTTFFGTTSDTGHLTVGVSLRQIAGDMTQFSRIYNTVIVASNQGSGSVPEERGVRGARCKLDCCTDRISSVKYKQRLAKKWSLGCENILPGPAWLLLSKTGPLFGPSLYI